MIKNLLTLLATISVLAAAAAPPNYQRSGFSTNAPGATINAAGSSITNVNTLRANEADLDLLTLNGLDVSTAFMPTNTHLADLSDGELTGSKVGSGIAAGNITTGTLGEARLPPSTGTMTNLTSNSRVSAALAVTGALTSDSAVATNDSAIGADILTGRARLLVVRTNSENFTTISGDSTTGRVWGINAQMWADASTDSVGSYRGTEGQARTVSGSAANYSGPFAGGFFQSAHHGSGNMAEMIGSYSRVFLGGTSTVTITNAYGVRSQIVSTNPNATIKAVAWYADPISSAGPVSENWGFKDTDTTRSNFLAGPLILSNDVSVVEGDFTVGSTNVVGELGGKAPDTFAGITNALGIFTDGTTQFLREDGTMVVPPANAIAGTILGTGTPAQYELPMHSDTTGTNTSPSGVTTDGSGNVTGESFTATGSDPSELALPFYATNHTDGFAITFATNEPTAGQYYQAQAKVAGVIELLPATLPASTAWDTITSNITHSGTDVAFLATNDVTSLDDFTLSAYGEIATGGTLSSAFDGGRATIEGAFSKVAGTLSFVAGSSNLLTTAGINASFTNIGDDEVRAIVVGNSGGNYASGIRVRWQIQTNGVASALPYMVNQRYEGAGYDNGETWIEAGTGTINEDYSSDSFEGEESLQLNGASGISYSRINHGAEDEIWGYMVVKFSALAAEQFAVGYAADGADYTWGILLDANGKLTGYHDFSSGNTPVTTDAVNVDTWTHIWWHWKKSTGASDGIISVGFSTDGTEPTSGDAFTSISNGNGTADTVFGGPQVSSWAAGLLVDKFLMRNDQTLGSNPE